jgi:hypothetical protein
VRIDSTGQSIGGFSDPARSISSPASQGRLLPEIALSGTSSFPVTWPDLAPGRVLLERYRIIEALATSPQGLLFRVHDRMARAEIALALIRRPAMDPSGTGRTVELGGHSFRVLTDFGPGLRQELGGHSSSQGDNELSTTFRSSKTYDGVLVSIQGLPGADPSTPVDRTGPGHRSQDGVPMMPMGHLVGSESVWRKASRNSDPVSGRPDLQWEVMDARETPLGSRGASQRRRRQGFLFFLIVCFGFVAIHSAAGGSWGSAISLAGASLVVGWFMRGLRVRSSTSSEALSAAEHYDMAISKRHTTCT